MPGLLSTIRPCFAAVEDRRRPNSVRHTLTDTLSAALAVFSLKYPSLLQFDNSARLDEVVAHNLRALYGVRDAPCDTQMRSILDPLEPSALTLTGVDPPVLTKTDPLISQKDCFH
jgi:hypothetical protein